MNISDPMVIIGGGAMGGAIAVRWRQQGMSVHVVEPDARKHEALSTHGIICHTALANAPSHPAAILLAMKPQQFAISMNELKTWIAAQPPLTLSIMAGIPLAALHQISSRAVRTMPNLPALLGESMTVAYAPNLNTHDHALTTQLFETIGQLAWVEDEAMLHSVTAISGSGPGYLFAFMDALEKAAVKQGLSTGLARQLIRQTMRGAALLAEQSSETFTALATQVASPGGTTQAALNSFSKNNFSSIVSEAVDAAAARSRTLAES